MGTGIKMGGGGAIKVRNGVIGEYYSVNGEIKPNTFVKVGNVLSEKTISGLNPWAADYGHRLDVCKLSETKYLFGHAYNLSPYSCVLRVATVNDDDTLSVGTATQLYSNYGTTRYGNENVSIKKIDETHALVAYNKIINGNGYNKSYAVVVQINADDSITIGTPVQLSYASIQYYQYSIGLEKIDNTHFVACTFSNQSASRKYNTGCNLQMLSVSGMSVNINYFTTLESNWHNSYNYSACLKLDDTHLLVIYSNTDNYVYGRIVSWVNGAFTTGTALDFSSNVSTATRILNNLICNNSYIYLATEYYSRYSAPSRFCFTYEDMTLTLVSSANESGVEAIYGVLDSKSYMLLGRNLYLLDGSKETKIDAYSTNVPGVMRGVSTIIKNKLVFFYFTSTDGVIYMNEFVTGVSISTDSIDGLLISKATEMKKGKVYTL